MSSVSMTGSDVAKINGRILNDLADGDCITMTRPSDMATVKTGKNGNSIYALNETGRQADMVLRIIRGSSDDKFLQGLLDSQTNNFAGFILMTGEFTKMIGNGQGAVVGDTHILSGGIFGKRTEAKSNVEGDSGQSIAEYHLKWANAPRVIG